MNKNRNPKNNICRITKKECIHPFFFYGDKNPIFPGDQCLVFHGTPGHWMKAIYLGPVIRVYKLNDGVISGGFPDSSHGLFQILKDEKYRMCGRTLVKRRK